MLRTERTGPIAKLILDHDKNAVSGPFCTALRQALAKLAADDGVRAVVVGGEGKYFCTGLDLEWMKAQAPDVVYRFLLDVSELLKETAVYPKPLLGAINGHAFGLGTIWACGFDYRVANAERGFVCFPEFDINIPFTPGMVAICEHGLGTRVFREMAWSAKRYPGPEAVAVGWAHTAVAGEAVWSTALERAELLAAKGTAAVAMTKQTWARHVVRIIDTEDAAAIRKIRIG